MKIRVQREEDNRTEVLTLVPPITMTVGEEFNTISDGSGMRYQFMPETGKYDHWRISTPVYLNAHKLMTEEQANQARDRINDSREIL